MKDLTTGHEGKSILLFTLPMLIGALFQQLYNTADSIIVGQFIGKNAMAAVSGANPIMFLLTSLLMGITLGFSILIAQYYGSKNMDKVRKTIDTTYVFVFVSSIIITIVGILICEPILKLMNTPEDIMASSRTYLIIIFIGTIFSAGYNSIAAILRGLGDSKNPLYFLIIATVLNILLDAVFIIYMKMGVEGAALATIISQACSFIFSVIYLNRSHKILNIRVHNIQFSKGIFKKGLKLGIPSAIQQMLFSFGNIALQSLVNSFGADAMAAFGAGLRIESFISLPIMNLGSAVSTFVAQNKGAKKPIRIKNGIRYSVYMSIIIAITVAILFALFSEQFILMFNSDAEVLRIGTRYLNTIGPFFIFISISFMLTSAIKGSGNAIFPLISSIVSLWIARLPGSYFFSSLIGVDGIWIGIPLGWLIGFIITLVYYKKANWNKELI